MTTDDDSKCYCQIMTSQDRELLQDDLNSIHQGWNDNNALLSALMKIRAYGSKALR